MTSLEYAEEYGEDLPDIGDDIDVNQRMRCAEAVADRFMANAAPEFVEYLSDHELPSAEVAAQLLAGLLIVSATCLGDKTVPWHPLEVAMRAMDDLRTRYIEYVYDQAYHQQDKAMREECDRE